MGLRILATVTTGKKTTIAEAATITSVLSEDPVASLADAAELYCAARLAGDAVVEEARGACEKLATRTWGELITIVTGFTFPSLAPSSVHPPKSLPTDGEAATETLVPLGYHQDAGAGFFPQYLHLTNLLVGAPNGAVHDWHLNDLGEEVPLTAQAQITRTQVLKGGGSGGGSYVAFSPIL